MAGMLNTVQEINVTTDYCSD